MPEPRNTSVVVDAARAALLEITPDETIGDLAAETDEGDGITTVQFHSALPGYPGWKWTVSLSTLDAEAPSILETELIPGDGSLLAPDWVPWSDRLADYKAAQEAAAEAEASDAVDDADDSDDESDDEDDDDDDLGSDVLHGGDLDGVDIDIDADDIDGPDDSDDTDDEDGFDDDADDDDDESDDDESDDDSDDDEDDDDDPDEGPAAGR